MPNGTGLFCARCRGSDSCARRAPRGPTFRRHRHAGHGRRGIGAARKDPAPGIKVLFATGYPQQATEREALQHGKLLFKPLRQAELLREVEVALSA